MKLTRDESTPEKRAWWAKVVAAAASAPRLEVKERWTDKKPTAPGLYWHVMRGGKEVRIIEIADRHGSGELQAFYMGWDIPQEVTAGLWMKARKPSAPAQPRDYRK